MVNADGLKTGATVAVVALGLLFAGQVWTMTVRWVSRALSGAILVLLAAGLGYAAYQLYAGWQAAEGSTADRRSLEDDGYDSVDDVHDGYLEEELSESELEAELEGLVEE